MAYLAWELVNLTALVSMGAGFFWKDRRCHILRSFGWTLLGIHWFAKAPDYVGHNDAVNALGAALALPIFLFLAYHEWRSYQWDDEYAPLRFVAGALFITGMGYFIVGNIAEVREFLIETIARQSVWLANLAGYDFGIGAVTSEYTELTGVPIQIILECTAIQAFLVAGAFLFGCRGDKMKRLKTFLLIAPVIYIVNVVRNAIVIILTYNHGPDYFDFAHNYIGKTLSLVTLIILIIIAFVIVPELYEDINGLFELPWRREPNHDYLQFVGRIYKEKDEKISDENASSGGSSPTEDGEAASGETLPPQSKPET